MLRWKILMKDFEIDGKEKGGKLARRSLLQRINILNFLCLLFEKKKIGNYLMQTYYNMKMSNYIDM